LEWMFPRAGEGWWGDGGGEELGGDCRIENVILIYRLMTEESVYFSFGVNSTLLSI